MSLAQLDLKSLFESKICVGVDLGSHSIKAMHAAKGVLPLKINRCLTHFQSEANEAFLQNSFRQAGLVKKPAGFALSDEKVEVHEFQLPMLKGKELETAIDWEVRKAVTSPEFAYHDHNLSSNSTGYDVNCLVAAKEVVEARFAEGKNLHLNPRFLEPESSALLATAKLLQGKKDLDRVAIVDIGHLAFRLVFVHGGRISFVRSIYPGLQPVCDSLAENGVAAIADQITLFRRVRMNQESPEEDPVVGFAERLLQESLYTLCEEIRRSEFFAKEQKNIADIEKILLCGGGACVPYTFDYLANHLTEKQVEVLNPFKVAKRVPDGLDITGGPAFACALGLSLRDIL